jgi:hypothetical protein
MYRVTRLSSGALFTLLGGVALIGSSLAPWYTVPLQEHQLGWATISPSTEFGFRLGALAVGLVFLVCAIRFRANVLCRSLAAVALVACASFPRFSTIADPAVGSGARWINQVHSNLSWLGGDIALSQGMSEDLLLQDVLLSDSPSSFSAIPDPRTFRSRPGLHWLANVFEWLGYGNAFGAFVRIGWVLALLGALAAITGSVLERDHRKTTLRSAIRGPSMLMLLSAFLSLEPIWRAGGALMRAESATHDHHYKEAISFMEEARDFLPLLEFDTKYLAQIGLLRLRSGEPDHPAARLYRARIGEGAGGRHSSRGIYRDLVMSPSVSEPVRREAARALAVTGYISLNTGATDQGIADLRIARSVLSNDPKIQLGLQLGYLRTGQSQNLLEVALSTQGLYEEVNLPSAGSVVAFGLDALARDRWANGDAVSASSYSQLKGAPR